MRTLLHRCVFVTLLAAVAPGILAGQTDVEALRARAEQGNAPAQRALGFSYANGQGVPQSEAEAVKWWRKAAEQGDAYAQFNLGGAYANGEGVPQDYAEAAWWIRRAAEQGNTEAQGDLGAMYFEGIGVPQDDAEAVKWIRKAAEQGDVVAQSGLAPKSETNRLDSKSIERRMSDEFVSTEIHARIQVVGSGTAAAGRLGGRGQPGL